MTFSLSYSDYLAAMRGSENKPASLQQLLMPFGISGAPSVEDEFLLIGHVLDALQDAEIYKKQIDAVMLVDLALDLGMSTVAS